MKKGLKIFFRIIISLLYLAWGALTVKGVVDEWAGFDGALLLVGLVGVLTFFAGVFGLLGIKKLRCRIWGIVIFVTSVVSIVAALPDIEWSSVVSAAIAWLFILCI